MQKAVVSWICCIALWDASTELAQAERISPLLDNGFPDNGDIIVVGDPASILRSPKSVFIHDRRATRITVLWADRTDVEIGYRVERADVGQFWSRPDAGDWQEVATTGPQDGFPEIVDNGLTPELYYCYRIIAVGQTAEIPSGIRCAVTHAAQTQPIFRAQLKLRTADLANANTNDDIEVLLQHRAVIVPTGNSTWINYSRNDFERGDEFAYDLDFSDLRRISDITQIYIEKSGSDDWCVSKVELIINELTYFEQEFADLPDGCFWLNTASDRRLVIPFQALRTHAEWGRFNPQVLALLSQITSTLLQTDDDPVPEGILITALLPSELMGLLNEDMRSRVEGIIGDIIATQDAHWRGPSSGEDSSVSVVAVDEDTYRVFFSLIGESPVWLEARIEVSVDLDVAASCNEAGDQVHYSIEAHNLDVDADFVIWWLENNIEGEIEDRFPGVQIGQRLPLEGLPDGVRCIGVPVTISDAGDVEIRLLLADFFQDEAPEPLPPVLPGDEDDDAPEVGPAAVKKY